MVVSSLPRSQYKPIRGLLAQIEDEGTMKAPKVVPDPVGAITGLAGTVGAEIKEVGQIGQLIGQMTGKKGGEGGIGANP